MPYQALERLRRQADPPRQPVRLLLRRGQQTAGWSCQTPQTPRQRFRRTAVALCMAHTLATPACAIVYRDAETGAVHLWGIGHLTMRATVPDDGKKAVIEGVTMCGVATGLWDGAPFVLVGWERRQSVQVVDADTAFTIELPNSPSDLLPISVSGAPLPTQPTLEDR